MDDGTREHLRTLAAHGWAVRRYLRWIAAALWTLAAAEALRLLVEIWRGP